MLKSSGNLGLGAKEEIFEANEEVVWCLVAHIYILLLPLRVLAQFTVLFSGTGGRFKSAMLEAKKKKKKNQTKNSQTTTDGRNNFIFSEEKQHLLLGV